jgi:regulatory protein
VTPPPVVTALRAVGSGTAGGGAVNGRTEGGRAPKGSPRVAVDLDGRSWRTLPLEAVLRAGLSVGAPIDRPVARTLARELRRLEARDVALRALRRRDHTRASLEQRLAERGTAPELRRETVAAAERAGLVDDARFAADRAQLLAHRGAGNRLIAHDLEQHGVQREAIEAAIDALEPEPERVERVLAARGASLRTARYLASRGFSEEAFEGLIADLAADGLR